MEHLIMLKRKGKISRSKLGVWKVKDSLFFDRAFYKREIITVNIPSILISFSSWLLRNNKSPSNFADHQTSLSFSYKDHKTGNGITCILNVTSPNPTQNIPTWQMLRPCSVSHCWSSLHSTLEKLTNRRDFSQTMHCCCDHSYISFNFKPRILLFNLNIPFSAEWQNCTIQLA